MPHSVHKKFPRAQSETNNIIASLSTCMLVLEMVCSSLYLSRKSKLKINAHFNCVLIRCLHSVTMTKRKQKHAEATNKGRISTGNANDVNKKKIDKALKYVSTYFVQCYHFAYRHVVILIIIIFFAGHTTWINSIRSAQTYRETMHKTISLQETSPSKKSFNKETKKI